jgi:glycosyltransferase involved in cell wall biosynthesis
MSAMYREQDNIAEDRLPTENDSFLLSEAESLNFPMGEDLGAEPRYNSARASESVAGLTVSVIVCAWTEERLSQTVACIEAIKRQTVPADEILIVVDGNPGLVQTLNELVGEVATVMSNTLGQGAGRARNAGMRVARGDLAAFVDDDAEPAPDWIARFVPRFADLLVLGVGGTIEPVWESGRPAWFPDEFGWAVGCTYRGVPDEAEPVRNLIAANMIVRREVIMRSGGFGSQVCKVGKHFGGPEEHELCHRVQQANPGGVWLFDPAVRVLHNVPALRATWAYYRHRCVAEGSIKAKLVAIVGSNVGLSSERSHVLGALREGLLHYLENAVRHRRLAGLQQAAAIVFGLAFTTYGYAFTRLQVAVSGVSLTDDDLHPAAASEDKPTG